MSKFPAVFVSHGAPDLSLYPSPGRAFLSGLGDKLGKPQAILMISAHWGTSQPMVSKVDQPDTIHDFWGFDPRLNSLKYHASGAPDLAQRVNQLLNQAGIKSGVSASRGLDHGAWNPLMLMYPNADIPVTQLSIQPRLTPEHHFQIGKALSHLRESGILIIASGSVTHNLREFGKYPIDEPPLDWVIEFSDWLSKTISQGDLDALLRYRQLAPHARKNHPTEEHLLPLFVALGAGNETDTSELHSSYTYGVVSMAAYAFN
ncbi:DODA-type extradiol aromatic ring-opening family dioxygenase [Pleurocapsa sp. FMAR1]|uniref:DODA-type extradiol aromatic ring-opening family dioxygenase n=1 Tax=Pleurocapsa sp. FMAR1 TaxID=3040204 RepID=UPI0029C6DEB7|nr:class III extradiol ring-cleavage dioxygenase [Pleurocapsa sp. FMAR1]